jgi:hypothetical protein
MRSRIARQDPEAGVYAILYAILCVVLIGMAAIVVDTATVRQDRRLDRAAADAAALGGARLLDYTDISGAQPQQACLSAWNYLASTLHISVPAGACSAFAGIDAASYCAVASPPLIADDRTVGSRMIRVAWPIPSSGDGGFLTPDIAPGSLAGQQPDNSSTTPGVLNTDGFSQGCDKIGVAVFQDSDFDLAGVWGWNGTTTQVHSVARVIPQAGPVEDAAALNVLNPTACESLVTTGGGKVTVGPVLNNAGTAISPGIIAVEAAGTTDCNGQDRVIDPTTGQGSKICASRTAIGAGVCDGQGLIFSHALDPGGNAARSYNAAAVPTNLSPIPTPEQGIRGYVPVTKRYGCNALASCQAPTPNYIRNLVNAYGGSGVPSTVYSSSQAPYVNPYPGAFTDRSSTLCPGGSGITTVVVVPAGNNYAGCTLTIKNGGAVIVQGGTLVVDGAVSVASGGCLVMNTAVTTCPSAVTGSGVTVSSPIPPVADAIVFVRGSSCPAVGCFDNAVTLVFPQTFVYAGGTSGLNQASTSLTLWTAPGAGARDVNGRTVLDNACYDATSGAPVKECLDSRFSRLTFWSEYAAPSTKPNQFAGQGALNVVGVFFTPRAYFNFTGGGGYTGAAAQFWSDQLNVNGGANLGLSPFESFVIERNSPDIVLIR